MVYLFVSWCCSVVLLCSITCNGINAEGAHCGHPAVPVNARVSLPDSPIELPAGTTATYTCDRGYELFGSSSITCKSTGVWEGDLPYCGTNIAFRKPTNQSTSVRGGASGNANDGQKTTVHDGRQCTETLKEASPWWKVDLLKPYPIRVVRVTTRGCCGHQPLQDLEVRVGNSSSDLQRNPLCAWYPGTIEEGVTKTFTCARTLIGQHVFLQLVGVEGSLSLCEVEVFTTEEFSNERCVPKGASADVEVSAFDRTCYEFAISKGGSFQEARSHCQAHNGDLIHGLSGPANSFLLAELEQRKPVLKTQLVWMGAQREPGFTSRTWRWVNGDLISRPAWGKDQPNNYNGEQNCVVLDGGRSWLWNDVGCNLDYLHWVCQHSSASCGSPDKLMNTTIISANHNEGASISYKCPMGHMLVGDTNRTCHQGFWTGRAPSCKYIDCGEVSSSLEHGKVVLEDKRTTYGASAVYSCHENYTLIGHEKRKCHDDGKWTGDLPQCLFDWCGEPPPVTGGSVKTSGHRSGATATYTCQAGYLLSGTGVLSCGLGGAWSGKAPICRYVDCGSPASADHGRYDLLNGTTTHGSKAKYTCEKDHWLDGEEILTCTREGKWSADAPSCVLITCEEPEVPPGSYVVGYDFNVHSTIEYNCEAGHVLQGRSTLQCTSQGEWSGETPKCHYVDCGKIPPMLYGAATYTNSTTYLGSEVTYSCSRNYRLIGVSSRKCLENSQWSGESPRCEEIRCPEPRPIEHSILSVTGNDRAYGRTLIRTAESAASVQTYKTGSLLKYRCERGYKVVGEPLSTCQDNGAWSGTVPECVYVDCGMPPAVVNGKFSLASNATYYGVAVLYECNENYQLDGHGRRLCMDNATWSSDTPTCNEIRCKEPEATATISVQVMTRSIGGVAHYSCPRGNLMEGNATRMCKSNGAWSGKTPFCKPVDCGQPGPIENGHVIVNNGTTYNSAVEYHCVQHFERIGPYLRRCMESAEWSGEEPRCEVGTGESNEPQTNLMTIGIAGGVILFLLIILGLIYLKLRKATPVKNTENVQAAVTKEEQTAAVTSYAAYGDTNAYGMPSSNSNIYENIRDQDNMYDAPYEETEHYEASPTPNHRRTNVTINGVSVR